MPPLPAAFWTMVSSHRATAALVCPAADSARKNSRTILRAGDTFDRRGTLLMESRLQNHQPRGKKL
jgi:hypothetical protein